MTANRAGITFLPAREGKENRLGKLNLIARDSRDPGAVFSLIPLMRLHFAAEMVLQIVYQLRPGIERIGAHISSDKARIDFASEVSLAPLFPPIEQKVAQLVEDRLPILTAFSDASSERRYWEVTGFAQMGCGGTHPQSTAEVGRLQLKRKNIGKGKERIEVMLCPNTEQVVTPAV